VLIAVLSDTHNDVIAIRKAIDLFNLRNVGLVLHCGDICSTQSAVHFKDLKCGFKAVYGNNDFYYADLENVISPFGIIKRAPFQFELSGKLFIMTHSISSIRFNLNDVPKNTYLLYGHTHQADLKISNGLTMLNPGEACGQRYGSRSAALIDLDKDEVEFVEL
jgi:putative phosphoesterase